MKSKDGITIFRRESSGGVYIGLRGTITINGKQVNKRISSGKLYNKENLAMLLEEAKPTFYEKLGVLLHVSVQFEMFLATAMRYINASVEEETARERESKMERYITPFFDGSDIKLLKPKDIEAWQLWLFERGATADMIRRCKALLSRYFDRAVVDGYISVNPVTGTSTIKGSRSDQKEIYTQKEISLMVEHSDGWLKVFILTFATLFLRSNEIIVLRWDDIDWTNGRIRIERAMRKSKMGIPKTGKRIAQIPPTLYSILYEYEKQCQGEYLFPSSAGTHYSDAAMINVRHFQPLLKRIGIPYRGMYELKHTGMSLMIQSGDLLFATRQAGHKNKDTALKYYAQFIENEESVQRADKVLRF